MVVYRVRCHNFIHGARNFDREIIVHEKRSRFRTLDMSQLRPYDDRREMLRRVVDDSRRELPVFAVEHPRMDQGWHRQEGSIIQMRGQ
jgi:hypothetical protein